VPIRPTDPIVVLTGAGISRESGLETFRDPDGIWARVRLEDVATPEGFARDPAQVHAFYNARRRGLLDPAIRPNAAHAALADLEGFWPGGVLLVTQNVDDLHARAGSRALVAMHGELLKARCAACGAVTGRRTDLSVADVCGACARAGGAHTVELNLEPSEGASLFAERVHGPATVVVPAFVERLRQLVANSPP
jgi:NAD-dependent deacetylase